MLRKIPLIFLVSLLLSTGLASLILALNNNLRYRQSWVFPKVDRFSNFPATFNSYSFSSAKISLAKGFLNMGVWHGHQQIETQNKYALSKVRFKARLDESSALYVYFSDTKNKKTGLRISNSNLFPPIKYNIDSTFKFSHIKGIELRADEKWNDYEIFLKDLDTENIDTSALSIGFRNEYRPVYLDDIELFNLEGKSILKENFFWTEKSFRFILITAFLFTLILLLVNSIFKNVVLLKLLTLFLVCGIIFGAVAFAYSNYIFATYPASLSIIEPEKLERLHQWRKYRPSNTTYYSQKVPILPLKKIEHITIMGSSQTFGEGATDANFTWPNRLHAFLQKRFKNKFVFENLAVPGHKAAEQLNLLNSKLPPTGSVLIFSMGNNDYAHTDFEKSVTELAALSERKKYTLLILFEPNNPQIDSKTLKINHEFLLSMCRKKQFLACLDIHSYLMLPEFYDTGWMWNDHVHGTDYTYKLMADIIASFLLNK